ncbi:formyltetrahydrofolate deformylase [Neomicrococcus lactis]|uniref:Formyltetrahydrofolate deformylase n=1 Tax=Neomicrococcus lactis TaxID=732241 RepID=A0A7W9DBZ0_9MICC|nr:formyltetrahydrofolate deformylase [Neomicrococcus lactis]
MTEEKSAQPAIAAEAPVNDAEIAVQGGAETNGEAPVETIVLTLSCPNTIGIVHAVTGFLVSHKCNISSSQQFDDEMTDRFFLRIQARCEKPITLSALQAAFKATAEAYDMEYTLVDADRPMNVLLMVSRFDHCLNDLLYRLRMGQLNINVPAIVSNWPDLKPIADAAGIPYIHIPVTKDTKPEAEAQLQKVIEDNDVELVVLARYMQVLSNEMTTKLAGKAINIHHSFLPGFKGAKPYHQAYDRGVKLVGATAHYVTADLDEGPIIEQQVFRVDHTHQPEDLVAAGRDAEAQALSRAVRWHSENRVMLNGHRTVVLQG